MRLMAANADDLLVVAALVQDGVCRLADMSREAAARRFTIGINRFRWELVQQGLQPARVRSGLMIEGVNAVRSYHLDQGNKDAVVDILALDFIPDEDHPPAGLLRMVLAGGGEIALEVECIDVTLADISGSWRTRRKPDHESDG